MKRLSLFILLGLTGTVFAPPLEIPEEARVAADRWLAALDTRDIEGTWEMAGREFREAMTREKWTEAVQQFPPEEKRIGMRHLVAAHFTRELPGGVRGQFVVFQFQRRGEKSGEVLVVSLQVDGLWRVAAYAVSDG